MKLKQSITPCIAYGPIKSAMVSAHRSPSRRSCRVGDTAVYGVVLPRLPGWRFHSDVGDVGWSGSLIVVCLHRCRSARRRRTCPVNVGRPVVRVDRNRGDHSRKHFFFSIAFYPAQATRFVPTRTFSSHLSRLNYIHFTHAPLLRLPHNTSIPFLFGLPFFPADFLLFHTHPLGCIAIISARNACPNLFSFVPVISASFLNF